MRPLCLLINACGALQFAHIWHRHGWLIYLVIFNILLNQSMQSDDKTLAVYSYRECNIAFWVDMMK